MSSLILIEGSFRVIWKLVALQACSAKRILREHCRPNLRTNEVDNTREAWSLLTYYAYARTSLTRARDITFIFENLDQRFSFVSLFEIRVSYLYKVWSTGLKGHKKIYTVHIVKAYRYVLGTNYLHAGKLLF